MDLKKKNNNSSFSLPAHLLSAVLSIGITALILWLATGMSIATVIADAFSLGFYVGAILLVSVAPALLASPIVLPAIFLVSAGLILGAAAVGLAWKLISKFGAGSGNSDNVAKDDLNTIPELNPEGVQQKSLTQDRELNQQKNQDNGFISSISIGLTAVISSGATVLLGIFASEFIISASIIPVFLLGMATAILLLPPLIAFSAALDLPLLISAAFIGGGFAAGAAISSVVAYLRSSNSSDNVDSLKTTVASDQPQDSSGHSPRKMLDGLGIENQNTGTISGADLKNHKPVFKNPGAVSKTAQINLNDESSCYPLCGL